jgi:uncharacterized membrane protein
MHLVLFVTIASIGGIAVGVIFSAWFMKEKTATVADLTSWRARLASAATADEAKAKLEMKNVVTEIETALKKV